MDSDNIIFELCLLLEKWLHDETDYMHETIKRRIYDYLLFELNEIEKLAKKLTEKLT